MKRTFLALVLLSLALTGCPSPGGNDGDGPVNGDGTTVVPGNAESDPATPDETEAQPGGSQPAESSNAASSTADNQISLAPDNTSILFIGTHTGEKPDPRTGKFTAFTGTLEHADGKPVSVKLDIDTASLTTDIDKLTDHLKSPDFFDVRQHPKAGFVSTRIENSDDGMVTITGDLTLLGETQSISFPATVRSGAEFSLDAEFTIDRTQFGMDYGLDKIEKPVTLVVTVSE